MNSSVLCTQSETLTDRSVVVVLSCSGARMIADNNKDKSLSIYVHLVYRVPRADG